DIRGHFIMGMPGQTFSEILETYAFIAKMAWVGVHDVNSYFFSVPRQPDAPRPVAQGKIDPTAPDYDELLAGACYTDFKSVRSWSEHFSPAVLRLFCLTSMAFFYVLSFSFRPLRVVQAGWHIVRGEPVSWAERVLHEGVKQYVLRRKISRVAVQPGTAARAITPARGVPDRPSLRTDWALRA